MKEIDMKHKLNMKKKRALPLWKIPTLDWFGPETKILHWGRWNIRTITFSVSWLLIWRQQYLLCFSRPAACTSFPQREEPQNVFLYLLNVWMKYPHSSHLGSLMAAWVQCCQDSLCTVDGCVSEEALWDSTAYPQKAVTEKRQGN